MKLVIAVVVLASQALAFDVTSLCPGVFPVTRVPATAEGTFWWLVAGTPMNAGSCGLMNNQSPCECVSFKFSSVMRPPYIPSYNTSVFGYDSSASSSIRQDASLTLIDPTQAKAVFTLLDHATGATSLVTALDTDNHESYVVLYICGATAADGSPIVFIISRDKSGVSSKNQAKINAVLEMNNIAFSSLQTFDTSSCLDSNLV